MVPQQIATKLLPVTLGHHTGTGTSAGTPINQFFHICGKFLNVYHIFFRTFFPCICSVPYYRTVCILSGQGNAKFSDFFRRVIRF